MSEEVRAIRERVAIIDQSSFSKFEISGPGAREALDRIAANTIPPAPGCAVYTQMCNARGGVEADVTVTKQTEERFVVVVTDTIGLRPEALESGKFRVVTVAPLLGEAIRRINNEESVSSLFV